MSTKSGREVFLILIPLYMFLKFDAIYRAAENACLLFLRSLPWSTLVLPIRYIFSSLYVTHYHSKICNILL